MEAIEKLKMFAKNFSDCGSSPAYNRDLSGLASLVVKALETVVVKCDRCGQVVNAPATPGEYPCSKCGKPTVHDIVTIDMRDTSETLEIEKRRRVYYQDIVYAVCRQLDRMRGRISAAGIACGTIEEPSTAVQVEMKSLTTIILAGKHAIDVLRQVAKSESPPAFIDSLRLVASFLKEWDTEQEFESPVEMKSKLLQDTKLITAMRELLDVITTKHDEGGLPSLETYAACKLARIRADELLKDRPEV